MFKGSSKSRLSMCEALGFQVKLSVLDMCFEFFVKMMFDAILVNYNMPISYYDAKMMVLKLRLKVKRIVRMFFDIVFNIMIDVKGKRTDNEKSKNDLELLCNWKDIELKSQPNGKLLKSETNYNPTLHEVITVFMWLNELRMHDGYYSNISRCVNVNTKKLHMEWKFMIAMFVLDACFQHALSNLININ